MYTALQACLAIGVHAAFATSHSITSSVHGHIDALAPDLLPGLFATTIHADSAAIAAPCRKVWRGMVEFSKYGSWNSFTTKVSVEPTLELGAAVTMRVEWPRASPQKSYLFDFPPDVPAQTEYVSVLEPGRALAYGGYVLHSSFLQFERVQFLEPADTQEGCTYHTFDRFSGLLNPINSFIFGAKIRAGFNQAAQDLKNAVEGEAAGGETGSAPTRSSQEHSEL
jgi:hypothetical protein